MTIGDDDDDFDFAAARDKLAKRLDQDMSADARKARERSARRRILGTVCIELTPDQAAALAQMCKRFTHDDAVRFAVPHDGGKERDDILAAVTILQRELAAAGFAPR